LLLLGARAGLNCFSSLVKLVALIVDWRDNNWADASCVSFQPVRPKGYFRTSFCSSRIHQRATPTTCPIPAHSDTTRSLSQLEQIATLWVDIVAEQACKDFHKTPQNAIAQTALSHLNGPAGPSRIAA
jgi:hypothetical protein